MRLYVLLFVLLIAACRRPSTRLAGTLTPTGQPNPPISTTIGTANLPDYGRYLKAGDELVAQGNEPFWSLTINPSKGIMRFKTVNGDSISAPVPERIPDDNNAFRYDAPATNSSAQSGRLTARFRTDSCVDTVSGQRYDYRVDVTAGGKTYSGCGVSLRQVALLQDIWVLTDFGGRKITAGGPRNELPRLEISLTEGRVMGTTGCNRLSGPVKADSRQIQFGPLVTTKMACSDEIGRFEGDFLETLSQALTYRVADGKLTLLRDGKPVMIFKKVD